MARAMRCWIKALVAILDDAVVVGMWMVMGLRVSVEGPVGGELDGTSWA